MRIPLVACLAAVCLPFLQAHGHPAEKKLSASGDSKASSSLKPVITPEGRAAVYRGTKWLMSALQRRGVGVDVDQPPDLSCTAIVGLALLSQGNTSYGGPHCRELKQILNIVLNQVEQMPSDHYRPPARTLVHAKIGKNSDLFLSALFLSQMLGDSGKRTRPFRSPSPSSFSSSPRLKEAMGHGAAKAGLLCWGQCLAGKACVPRPLAG